MGFIANLIIFICKNCKNWFTFDEVITDYVMSCFFCEPRCITEKWIFCTEPYRSIFNHCDVIGLLIYRFRWNNAKYGLLRRSRSFEVTDSGPNQKLICDFLY